MNENKVLGIDVTKYVKICYLMVLIASGYGVLTNLCGLAGIYLPGGFITGIIGLAGLALTVTGWLVYKEKFSAVDISHFKYLVIILGAFFVIYVVFVNALAGFGVVGAFFITIISLIQFSLLFVGFRTWKVGQEATQTNLKASFRSIKART